MTWKRDDAKSPIARRATSTVSSVLPSSTRISSQSVESSARIATDAPITRAMLAASLWAGMTRLNDPSSDVRSSGKRHGDEVVVGRGRPVLRADAEDLDLTFGA